MFAVIIRSEESEKLPQRSKKLRVVCFFVADKKKKDLVPQGGSRQKIFHVKRKNRTDVRGSCF